MNFFAFVNDGLFHREGHLSRNDGGGNQFKMSHFFIQVRLYRNKFYLLRWATVICDDWINPVRQL